MAAPIILVDATPRDVATGGDVVVQLAGGGDGLPYPVAYRAGITSLPSITATLDFDGQEMGGGGIPQATGLSFAPPGGAGLAFVAGNYWPDAPITVRIGAEGGGAPPVALVGTVLEAPVKGGALQIAVADPAAKLKRPLLVDRFAGTGGLEGPVELTGVAKSRAWGVCFNVPARPLDPANNILCFGDPMRRWQGIDMLRDRGAPVDPDTLTPLAWQGSAAATFAALQAADAIEGGGVVAPDIASVKWWADPGGLTADIRGEIAGGYVDTAPEIAARIVAARGGPAFAAGTVAAAKAARPAKFGWRVEQEPTTAADALSEILGDISTSWLLVAGEIVLRPWEWDAPAVSATSFAVERRETFRPIATRKLGYQRNWHPVSRGDLADIVFLSDILLDDGTPIDKAVEDLIDPNVLTGAEKASSFALKDAETSDRHDALVALAAPLLSANPAIAAARNIAISARTFYRNFRDTISPPWDDVDHPSTFDRDDYNVLIGAWIEALDALYAALMLGAPEGTLIAGVPSEDLIRYQNDSRDYAEAQGKSAGELVADGVVTYREQQRLAQLYETRNNRVLQLVAQARTFVVSSASLEAANKAVFDFLAAIPGFADPYNPPRAVDPLVWADLNNALDVEIRGLAVELDARAVRIETVPLTDWVFTGIATTGGGAAGTGAGLGRAKQAYPSPLLHAKLTHEDVIIGLRPANAPNDLDIATIEFGLRLHFGRFQMKIGAAYPDHSPQVFENGASVSIAVADGSAGQAIVFTVEGATSPVQSVTSSTPGIQWVPVILVETADGAYEELSLRAGIPTPYAEVTGGPPVTATAGANVADKVATLGASGPDADGFYSFDGTDALQIVGMNNGDFIPWGREPFAKVTVETKDDTGVGDAAVRIECTLAGGGGQSVLVNARTGGTVAFPLGTVSWRAFQAVAFTSGAIKMRPAVVVPTQEPAPANGGGGGGAAPNDSGVDITTWFALVPAAAQLATEGAYGMYGAANGQTQGSDNGTLDFKNGDRAAYFTTPDPLYPEGYTSALGARWLYILWDDGAVSSSGAGSVSFTVKAATDAAGTDTATIFTASLPGGVTPGATQYVELPADKPFVRIEMAGAVSAGYVRINWPQVALRASRVTAEEVVAAQQPLYVPADEFDRLPAAYADLRYPADTRLPLTSTQELINPYLVGLAPTEFGNANVLINTAITRTPLLEEMTNIKQTTTYEGVEYYRYWEAGRGVPQTAWIYDFPDGPFNDKAPWLKSFANTPGGFPALAQIEKAPGVALDPVEVLNMSVTMTASGRLLGASPAAPQIDATLLLNGPIEANADSTVNNVPFGYSPFHQIGGGTVTVDTPYLIYNPRYKGAINRSPQAEWTAGLTDGLTGTLDDDEGSATRGVVSLTKVEAMLGFVTTSSVDEGAAFAVTARIEKSYPRIPNSTNPRSISVGFGAGCETTARIVNSTAWADISSGFTLQGQIFEGQYHYPLSFQASAAVDIEGVEDNSCTVEYKLQRKFGGTWQDILSLGTSTTASDWRDAAVHHLAVGNRYVRPTAMTPPNDPEDWRLLARLSNAASSVTIKSVIAFNTIPSLGLAPELV